MRTQHGTPVPTTATDLPFAGPSLFDLPPVFDGATYEPEHDQARLTGHLKAVYEYLASHDWVTIAELAQAVGCSEAGASARIRDLRKPKFGHHQIDRKRVEGGLYMYRVNLLATSPMNEVK